jgi:uncharacterized phage protein (TIGR01671 family)
MTRHRFRGYCYQTGQMSEIPENNPLNVLQDRDDWKVMESSGLNDKHGRAIYEDDITNAGIVKYGFYIFDDSGGRAIETYGWHVEHSVSFADNLQFAIVVPLTADLLAGMEVIGNIYENADML